MNPGRYATHSDSPWWCQFCQIHILQSCHPRIRELLSSCCISATCNLRCSFNQYSSNVCLFNEKLFLKRQSVMLLLVSSDSWPFGGHYIIHSYFLNKKCIYFLNQRSRSQQSVAIIQSQIRAISNFISGSFKIGGYFSWHTSWQHPGSVNIGNNCQCPKTDWRTHCSASDFRGSAYSSQIHSTVGLRCSTGGWITSANSGGGSGIISLYTNKLNILEFLLIS